MVEEMSQHYSDLELGGKIRGVTGGNRAGGGLTWGNVEVGVGEFKDLRDLPVFMLNQGQGRNIINVKG